MKKKKKQTTTTMPTEYIAILKDNGANAPSMFVKKNDFTTTDPLEFWRGSDGRYTISGFSFDGEGLLPLETTEIYFGKGNETLTNKWAKLETNNPNTPAQEVSVFTDDSGVPSDGLLNYVTIKIVV